MRPQTLAAASAMAIAALLGYGLRQDDLPVAPAHAVGVAAVPTAAPAAAALPDFSAIVARNGPAVVNISTTQELKNAAYATPFGDLDRNDPFREFFRHFRVPAPNAQPVHGLGSGFIVSPDGVILTNAHVVDGASEVTVKLTDRREFRAKVLGADKQSDVAVLKIDARGLPTVTLGDPAAMRVGEWALAIGSPFGFENSATAGIVSAKSRTLPDESYVPFIQTDVAVNPGNSGGPLFNTRGEVIGINSQIYSRSGGYQGLSFAIPIDVAAKVERQILQHGKVTRGRLGVSIQDVTQALAESFGLPKTAGALVAAVESGSPAARAGLQPGDVILAFDGKPIERSSELPALVADTEPGRHARLEVWHKGAARTLDVTMGRLEGAPLAAASQAQGNQGRLGLAVRPLAPEERTQAHTRGGVVVEDASGPAARAGIQPGDVILSVNGTPVASVAELRALAAKAGKHVALLVRREDATLFVPVDLG